jgi:hypothetical protein
VTFTNAQRAKAQALYMQGGTWLNIKIGSLRPESPSGYLSALLHGGAAVLVHRDQVAGAAVIAR